MKQIKTEYYIKYVDHKEKSRRRYFFFCPYCKKNVFKDISHGKRDKSCGCVQYKDNKGHYKHGGYESKLYYMWNNMRQRCYNKSNPDYKWYGLKSVIVCGDWLDFSVFRDWCLKNGYVEGLTIDRKDSNEGYSPNNCNFITQSENTTKANKERWSNRQ